ILSREDDRDGAAFGNVLLFGTEHLNIGARGVRIGFGMVEAHPSGGAGPDSAARILVKLTDTSGGKALVGAVLDPGALEEAKEAAVGADPQAAVTGGNQRIDAIQPDAHGGPVPTVEGPDLVLGGAPELAVGELSEGDDGLGRTAVGRGESPPTQFVEPGRAAITADPKVAVVGGEKG